MAEDELWYINLFVFVDLYGHTITIVPYSNAIVFLQPMARSFWEVYRSLISAFLPVRQLTYRERSNEQSIHEPELTLSIMRQKTWLPWNCLWQQASKSCLLSHFCHVAIIARFQCTQNSESTAVAGVKISGGQAMLEEWLEISCQVF